jgi:hypothetical protein
MRHMTTWLKILGLAALVLLAWACNPVEDESKSPTMIVIESVKGTDSAGNEADYLQSDVIKVDATTQATSILADVAVATLRAATLDPKPVQGVSQWSDITLSRYVVSYSRVDGNNRPGVDVPYPFEGSMSILLKTSVSTDVGFVVVREVAKTEPPLVSLRGSRAERVIYCKAQIDFYGQDMTGKKVMATGYLNISFTDYADK